MWFIVMLVSFLLGFNFIYLSVFIVFFFLIGLLKFLGVGIGVFMLIIWFGLVFYVI